MFHIVGTFHSNRCVGGGKRNCIVLVQIRETATKIGILPVLFWNSQRRRFPKLNSQCSSPTLMQGKGQSDLTDFLLIPAGATMDGEHTISSADHERRAIQKACPLVLLGGWGRTAACGPPGSFCFGVADCSGRLQRLSQLLPLVGVFSRQPPN